ncbi:unnamed protein product [Kluyveromyces dobzhanskii CBS 2104]|uniref:WGS project CCBQ000000000 data, contig 00015 n=1 Tax=Kluyveromyces dobzhanskii CBS 2104 TaxID=1427455 RepID=A0A0A8LBH6_9SACH|nr:unnamed protein product [Kluyveromyces dobzhanskii CBS 2104]
MGFEFVIPTVANLPLEQPLFCTGDESISNAAKLMTIKRKYCILVKTTEKLEGIVTTKDLAFKKGLVARDVLSNTPVLTPSSMPVTDALQIMVEQKIRHLPIIDPIAKQIVGILDITKCFHQAMRRLEIMAQDSAKLNDAVQDVIEKEATMTRQKVLQDIAALVESMETPDLETILNSTVYNTKPLFAGPTTTVSEAMTMMSENKTTAVLIHDSSMKSNTSNSSHCNIIGIFTSKDFVCRVLAQGNSVDLGSCTLARVMTARPNFAFKNLGIHSALRMMYEGHFLNLPIIDDTGNILGLISVLQLTHAALSCQFASRSKNPSSQTTLEEPYLKIGSDESPSDSLFVDKEVEDFYREESASEPEAPNLSVNYFWKSFDVSDNESASSSQLSLVDLTQTQGSFNNSKSLLKKSQTNSQLQLFSSQQVKQEQFSGKRSSTLLQKKFFENGKHTKFRFKVSVMRTEKSENDEVLGSMRFKTHSRINFDKDILNELVSKVKESYKIVTPYTIKYMDTDITTNEKLHQIYDEFVAVHGSRHYMPLLFLLHEKQSGIHRRVRQFFTTIATPFTSIFHVSSLKLYMQACLVFFTGFMVGKVLK